MCYYCLWPTIAAKQETIKLQTPNFVSPIGFKQHTDVLSALASPPSTIKAPKPTPILKTPSSTNSIKHNRRRASSVAKRLQFNHQQEHTPSIKKTNYHAPKVNSHMQQKSSERNTPHHHSQATPQERQHCTTICPNCRTPFQQHSDSAPHQPINPSYIHPSTPYQHSTSSPYILPNRVYYSYDVSPSAVKYRALFSPPLPPLSYGYSSSSIAYKRPLSPMNYEFWRARYNTQLEFIDQQRKAFQIKYGI